MSFNNKNIVITGSSAGIGKASAELFLNLGANVIINGASNNGKKVVEELNKKYENKAMFVQADIASIDGCKKLFEESYKYFSKVDVLVNCAGIVPSGTLLDFDEKDFDEAFNINVKGAFFLSQMFARKMLEEKDGVIVNVGSIAGLIGPKNRALYSATKGALISLTRAMASDFAGTGLRVNCVCPGMVYSPSLKKRIDATDNPSQTEIDFAKNIPLKHIGTAEEIAHSIVFAANDENSYMTGSIITVDGGASL